MSKNQKIAVGGLLIFTAFVLFFWSNNLRSNLSHPFSVGKLDQPDGSIRTSVVANDISKTIDTDKDGLSDWDELNVYGTSPYLEDTDSDGVSDRLELLSGTNPNCIGEACGLGAPITDEKLKIETPLSSEVIDRSLGSLDLEIEEGELPADTLMNILSGGGDAVLLRQTLITAGMDKKLLDQISDEVLMANYQKLLESQEVN